MRRHLQDIENENEIKRQVKCLVNKNYLMGIIIHNNEQKIPIFISSTYTDLKPYRKAVSDILETLNVDVHGMEKFGARPSKPIETCIDEVRRCNIFIGIIGMRYGSVHENDDGRSYVQIEYESAIADKKEILIYIVDEDKALFPPKHVDTDDNAKKLKLLKNRLKRDHTVEFFEDPSDLANKIKRDLSRLLNSSANAEPVNNSPKTNSDKILPLIRILHDDYNDRKRNWAAQQLRDFNNEQVIEALLQSVKYDKKVRYEALTSLYKLKSEKALGVFTERLFDPSPRIRNISIIALGEIGGESNLIDLHMIIDTYDSKDRNKKRSGGKGQRVNWGKSENVRAAETAIEGIEKRLGIENTITNDGQDPD